MRGVDILLRRPVEGAADGLGNPARSWGEPETVAGVLVASGDTDDATASNRPHGVDVAYTLVFPKAHSGSLRGCEVKVPGDDRWYRIEGDPKKHPDGQMARPLGRWDRIAKAVASDG